MARNLRAKIPASDTLIIRDVNQDAMTRFVEESQEVARSSGAGAEVGRVEIAGNAREVAEKSVSIPLHLMICSMGLGTYCALCCLLSSSFISLAPLFSPFVSLYSPSSK